MTIYVNARAFIEREVGSGIEVLLKIRVRPGEPERWELPGGQIEPFEPVLSALEREIAEETGLRLTLAQGRDSRRVHEGSDATVETFEPLFAYQTLRGPVDSLGFYFRCQADGVVTEHGDAAKQPTWFEINKLAGMFELDREQFDWLTQAALERYFEMTGYSSGVSER